MTRTTITLGSIGAALSLFMVFAGCSISNAPKTTFTPAPAETIAASSSPAPESTSVETPSFTPAPATVEVQVEIPPATSTDALSALNTLQLVNVVNGEGYNREGQFGSPWKDVDGNSCDTRNDILNRDLINITYRDAGDTCVVQTGTLNDSYTGQQINFVRGEKTSGAVQIDHIIPLKYAYMHGAMTWTQDTRVAFANDPVNLLASDGPTNGSKNAKGPENWMPENTGFVCSYAEKFVTVADKYDVSITTNDYDTLYDALLTCSA